MELNYISIGRKVKELRKKKSLSQSELSELVGLSPTYISYIENGKKGMSLEIFVLLANALNTSADELLLDSLTTTIKASSHGLAMVLSDCSDYEYRILHDMSLRLKISLRENKRYIDRSF